MVFSCYLLRRTVLEPIERPSYVANRHSEIKMQISGLNYIKPTVMHSNNNSPASNSWHKQWIRHVNQNFRHSNITFWSSGFMLCSKDSRKLSLRLMVTSEPDTRYADIFYTLQYTVSQKNILDIFGCNLKTNYQILIIFGTNISDTTWHQMTI